VQKALQILSINLNDHIIISRQGYYSLLDHNRMPRKYSDNE
jgi:DNA repair protein RadC